MTSPAPTELLHALAAPAHSEVPTPKSILVASDGTAESDSAIRYAQQLATRGGGSLDVVSVCEPLPLVSDWPSLAPVYVVEDQDVTLANRSVAVEAQLRRVLGAVDCPFTVQAGNVGLEIAARASQIGADLIVTGRGRHGALDRLLGEEHLARLLRAAKCPVLATEPLLPPHFHRVAVGVDFSEHGMLTARAAITLAADDAIVYLVHVKPDPPFGLPHPGRWLKSYDDGVRAGLEQFRAEIALPLSCTVEPIVISGHPGVALAEFARRSVSDLIAVGVHGSGFFNRLVIGSVTTYLLRAAPCSLLTVPSHTAPYRRVF